MKDEELFLSWVSQFGADKFLLGADVKNEKIAVGGWLETTDIWIYDFIEKYIEREFSQLFCTDVSKDGKLEGPAVELYKNIIGKFPCIAFYRQWGCELINDLDELEDIGCKGVIIGKAIYEGRISLAELSKMHSSSGNK